MAQRKEIQILHLKFEIYTVKRIIMQNNPEMENAGKNQKNRGNEISGVSVVP